MFPDRGEIRRAHRFRLPQVGQAPFLVQVAEGGGAGAGAKDAKGGRRKQPEVPGPKLCLNCFYVMFLYHKRMFE